MVIMNAEKIADEARDSISSFCYEECHAYCCRKGYLLLNEFNADAVTKGKKEQMIKDETLKKLKDGEYSMGMSSLSDGCPSLKDFKCTIHKSPFKTKACHEFPIFIDEKNKTIGLSPRCPAVKTGKFYAYEHQWLKMGYKLRKANPFSEMEINNMTFFGKK